jgi:hypothetical protein
VASHAVHFLLADGNRLIVEAGDTQRVYDELWMLANLPGAISTAGALMHEAHSGSLHNRQPIDLNAAQSHALSRAISHLAAP